MQNNWRRWFLLILLLGGAAAVRPAQATASQPIQLVTTTFDPLVDGQPDIPAALQAPAGSPYALLQLNGPIQASWAADFEAAGVVFYGYVPEFTYLAFVPTASRPVIDNHPAVRWLGSYHPFYKISPTLHDGRALLQLYPDADFDAALSAVALAGSVVVEQNPSAGLIIIDNGAALAPELARIESIYWIQNAAQMQELNDDARWVGQGAVPNTTPLHDRGLTGAGQVGAVSDSGLAVFDFGGGGEPSCFFADDGSQGAGGTPRLPGSDHRKVVAYSNPAGAIGDQVDGTGHGSHVVGSIAGDRPPWNERSTADGQAFDARIYFQDIGIGSPIGLINPPSDYRVLFAEAYDPNGDGVYQPESEPRTHSNSWGSTEATYSIETMQIDDFMWSHPDYLIAFAAGNQGPSASTVGQPATAKNIVTVGATENGLADPNSLGYFSSHGPAPFGRMKPTITAPGDRIESALAGDPCGTVEKTGTSMATPTVHGLTLLVRQYLWDGFYPSGSARPADRLHPSAALLKAMLINSGRPLSGAHVDNAGGDSWPSNGQGWGRVTIDEVLYFEGDHRALWLHDEYAVDGSQGFDSTGQTRTFRVMVGNGAPFAPEPLKVTLAWSDFPGLPPAGGPLVNNLDMTVTGPDGTVHLGNDAASNDFQGLPDLPAVMPDVINPWEVVYLAAPHPGEYIITISASNIASTVLDATRKQGFALVVTGDLQNETRAEIEFPEYETDGVQLVRARVTDLSANMDHSVQESITAYVSKVGTADEISISLLETGVGSGVFSGHVATGALHLSAGDTFELRYHARVDTAFISNRPVNFHNPPQLAPIPNDDLDNRFDLSWEPAEATTALAGYTIQETTTFVMPLFDDAEGDITTNWTTGQTLAAWSSSSQSQQSGASSFWSGRGDTMVLIDSALTLNHDVYLQPGISSARLGFYSRYFNDFNDYGHVEVAANGGAWKTLRRLYADPRVVPLDDRYQYHEFDLTPYIGSSIRIRFRFDNGVFSQAPDSPGWWLDNIAISGGTWRTVATVDAELSSVAWAIPQEGNYFYRVRGLYQDGSVTGWSGAVRTTVSVVSSPSDEDTIRKTTGGGWLETPSGKKLHVAFTVRDSADQPAGNLHLNDRSSATEIHIAEILTWTSADGRCGSITDGPGALAFQGSGTLNGNNAIFQVCVQDSAEPGRGSDRFYLSCIDSCSYTTTGQTVDDVIDGGNIQVTGAPDSQAASGDNDSQSPSTLILGSPDTSDGLPAQPLTLVVTAYDPNQSPLAGVAVILTQTADDGQVQSWSLLTDLTGKAVLTVTPGAQPSTVTASAAGLASNGFVVPGMAP